MHVRILFLALLCLAVTSCSEDTTPLDSPPVVVLFDEGFGADLAVSDMAQERFDASAERDQEMSMELDAGPDFMLADAAPDLPVEVRFMPCEITLEQHLETIARDRPGRGEDSFVTLALAISRQGVGSAQVEQSIEAARVAGYSVCLDDEDRLVWSPLDFTRGDALIVVALGATGVRAEVILEHPHPFFDGTLGQALPVFNALDARALIVSGRHRCSSDTPSPCDGRTSVCGETSAPYPVSDPAHVVEDTLDIAHRAISSAHPDALVLSMHGTGQGVSYTSNGTRVSDGVDPNVASLVSAMEFAFPTIEHRSCDAYDATRSGVWLCGTTNVQGRGINGVADACGEAATGASGRFLHIEQTRAMRDRPQDVADALGVFLEQR